VTSAGRPRGTAAGRGWPRSCAANLCGGRATIITQQEWDLIGIATDEGGGSRAGHACPAAMLGCGLRTWSAPLYSGLAVRSGAFLLGPCHATAEAPSRVGRPGPQRSFAGWRVWVLRTAAYQGPRGKISSICGFNLCGQGDSRGSLFPIAATGAAPRADSQVGFPVAHRG
jgi:hypothetical protein